MTAVVIHASPGARPPPYRVEKLTMTAMATGDCGDSAMPSVVASAARGTRTHGDRGSEELGAHARQDEHRNQHQPCHAVGSQREPATRRKMR